MRQSITMPDVVSLTGLESHMASNLMLKEVVCTQCYGMRLGLLSVGPLLSVSKTSTLNISRVFLPRFYTFRYSERRAKTNYLGDTFCCFITGWL